MSNLIDNVLIELSKHFENIDHFNHEVLLQLGKTQQEIVDKVFEIMNTVQSPFVQQPVPKSYNPYMDT